MFKTVSDSQKSSLALVYPANSFLAKPLCQALLRHHCQVLAVAKGFAENLLPLFDREGFTFLYYQDFEKKPPEQIDYVFEISGKVEFLSTAQKYKAKYEAILEKENDRLIRKLKNPKRLDYRFAVGHWVFGPGMELTSDDFITQTIRAGSEEKTLSIPGNGLMRIYPLFVNDLASGAVRAMFTPGTSGKIFHFYGSPITIFSFVHLIKEATKDQSKVEFVAPEKIGKIEAPESDLLAKLKQELDWQPKKDLKKVIKKTIWEIREERMEVKGTGKVGKSELPDKKLATPELLKPCLVEDAEKTKERVEIEQAGEGVLPPVDLVKKQEKIRLALEQSREYRGPLKLSTPSQPSEPQKVPKAPKTCLAPGRKSWRFLKIFLLLLCLCLSLVISPFVFITFKAYQGASYLKEAKKELATANFDYLNQKLKKAQANFISANQLLAKTQPILETLKLEDAFFVFDSWLSLANQITSVGLLGEQAARLATSFSKALLASQPTDLGRFVAQEDQLLEQLIAEISLLQTTLENQDNFKVNLPFFRPQKQIAEIKQYLPAIKNLAVTGQESLSLLPSLLARDSRKTYLILFQNNMELRPTGGFIGSFGLATFEKGRFLDFGILDVYAADGQLKGYVEPPEKLKEYLGEAGWYLRDSNWSPDFPTSARKAAWFLEKEMGRNVDGIIAINLNFAQKILVGLGGVHLPDYQEEINANNLFERAEYHSEIGTFPGSTQKSDFLGSLANAIFEKTKASGEKEFFGVAKGIYQSLEEQELLVYLNDSEAMKVVQKFGWNSEISRVSCSVSHVSCYPDYLMIVEANVGVNKANFFVSRRIDQKIEIDREGKVIHHLKITYENTAQTDAWPAGKYKNYLRVYTPQGSKIQDTEFEEFQEHGKTAFATLVEVPISEGRTVEISWELPEKLSQEERVSYLFFFQKQSGLIDTTNSLLFSFPVEMRPLLISPAGAYAPGSLLFTDDLSKSRTYRVEFFR